MTIRSALTASLLAATVLATAPGAIRVAMADPAPDLSRAILTLSAALDSAGLAPRSALARWPEGAPSAALRAAGHEPLRRQVDYLWVVRSALVSPAKVARVVARAREMRVKGLLAQVVGRGDAYYRSDLLPRAPGIAAAFDPLGELIGQAHAAGLEVHAWVNCLLVWSAPGRPRDPRHVLNVHPEWVARLEDGRPMTALTARQRRRLHIEGVFLSPADPGVRAWLGAIVHEIGARYAVDGVHLDYIRQPGVRLRCDLGTRAALADARDAAAAAPGAADSRDARSASQCAADPRGAWLARSAWRARLDGERAALQCQQVAAVVREVRDSLATVRPGLAFSAAVVADTAAAEHTHGQSWTSWLRQGLIDRAFVMCYAPAVRTVLAQLAHYAVSLGTGGRVVPGIAVYNTPPASAAAKIRAARALGFPELALYSYDALADRPGYWPRVRAGLDPAPAPAPASGGAR